MASGGEGTARRRAPLAYRMLVLFGRPVMRRIFSLCVEGDVSLPAGRGAIVCANHSSFLDIPALGAAFPEPLHFMATAKFAGNPVYRWLVRLSGSFLLPLSGRSPEAFHRAAEYLERGEVVAIYPEGGRSPDGRLMAGKPGMVRIALEAGVPIVPCAILGTFRAWPMGRLLPRRSRVTVRVGEPLDFSAYREEVADRRVVADLTVRVMAAIAALMERPGGCGAAGRSVSSPA